MALGSTLFDGRYLLLDVLGRGSLSTVYRVHDANLGVDRAMKVLSMEDAIAPDALGRFFAEVQLIARMQHLNVLAVQDIQLHEEQLYVVMELLEGSTLRSWVSINGPMPPQLAIETMLPILDALSCAHRLGVVHRAVTPENIFPSSQLRSKLSDFGVAHIAHSASASGARASTAWSYAPPEQHATSRLLDTPTVDIYAVGAVLSFLVSGRIPVTSRASHEHLPAPLHEIVRAATHPDPAERPASADALAEILREAQKALPPLPRGRPSLISPSATPSLFAVPVRPEFLSPLHPLMSLPPPAPVDVPEPPLAVPPDTTEDAELPVPAQRHSRTLLILAVAGFLFTGIGYASLQWFSGKTDESTGELHAPTAVQIPTTEATIPALPPPPPEAPAAAEEEVVETAPPAEAVIEAAPAVSSPAPRRTPPPSRPRAEPPRASTPDPAPAPTPDPAPAETAPSPETPASPTPSVPTTPAPSRSENPDLKNPFGR